MRIGWQTQLGLQAASGCPCRNFVLPSENKHHGFLTYVKEPHCNELKINVCNMDLFIVQSEGHQQRRDSSQNPFTWNQLALFTAIQATASNIRYLVMIINSSTSGSMVKLLVPAAGSYKRLFVRVPITSLTWSSAAYPNNSIYTRLTKSYSIRPYLITN